MFRISLLFLAVGILVIAFAVFVPAKDSSITIHLFDTFYVLSSTWLFKVLGLLGLIYAGLYHFTEPLLYSKTWSVMHLISFLCLIINVWTWGFVERVYFGNFDSTSPSTLSDYSKAVSFQRIQQFYVGALAIMIAMQLLYVLNLIIGLIYQKSNSEN